jgi:phytoene synthase
MSPDHYCENKAAPPGSSLYYSLLYLPAEKRRAAVAVQALCEELNAVADQRHDDQVAHSKLDWWQTELERCFAGQPQHPVTRALQEPLQRYNLAQEYFCEMLDGARMDLERRSYASFNELALYCYRSAGVASLLSTEIAGYSERETLDFAVRLGTALRLTDLLVNLRAHLLQGRVYIPLDELDASGVTPQRLLAPDGADAAQAVVRRQLERARKHFAEALQRLPVPERRGQTPALIQAAIARTLLDEIEADGLRVTQHRVGLTPVRKLWIAWKTARRERRHGTLRPC